MSDKVILLVISGIISVVVSLAITVLNDRLYPIFNKRRKKYLIEDQAPKLFAGKRAEVAGDGTQNVFVLTIVSLLNEEGGNPVEVLSGEFKLAKDLNSLSDTINFGFRLRNKTDSGISIDALYTKGGQKITLHNWTSRHVDSGETMILLYNLKDKPSKITAIFENLRLTYTIKIDSEYITPECADRIKKLKVNGSSVI